MAHFTTIFATTQTFSEETTIGDSPPDDFPTSDTTSETTSSLLSSSSTTSHSFLPPPNTGPGAAATQTTNPRRPPPSSSTTDSTSTQKQTPESSATNVTSTVIITSVRESLLSISQSATASAAVPSPSHGKQGILVGAIVGPVTFLLLLVVLLLILLIRRRKKQKPTNDDSAPIHAFIKKDGSPVTPFTEPRDNLMIYPEKSTTSDTPIPSPSTTVRKAELQCRINELIVRNAALEADFAAANENAHSGLADLRTEIEWLGQLLQSDRALELTDAPPPSYSNLVGDSAAL